MVKIGEIKSLMDDGLSIGEIAARLDIGGLRFHRIAEGIVIIEEKMLKEFRS